jgi:hypothetical protein
MTSAGFGSVTFSFKRVNKLLAYIRADFFLVPSGCHFTTAAFEGESSVAERDNIWTCAVINGYQRTQADVMRDRGETRRPSDVAVFSSSPIGAKIYY